MMRRLSFAIAAAILWMHAGLSHGAGSLDERKKKIQSMENAESPEALQRKERSELILRAEGVPLNKFLPPIEAESAIKRRAKDDVAYRALALLTVAVKGEGLEQPVVDRIVKDYGLAAHFTPKERAFIGNASPSRHDRIQFTWRYEAAWVMLWALGYVETLEKPTAVCDVPRALKLMRNKAAAQFVADARLRPLTEIVDQADRIYRYHWAVVDARIGGRKPPAGLEPGVTLERHHALNWLIGYMEQAWDDVSTDT